MKTLIFNQSEIDYLKSLAGETDEYIDSIQSSLEVKDLKFRREVAKEIIFGIKYKSQWVEIDEIESKDIRFILRTSSNVLDCHPYVHPQALYNISNIDEFRLASCYSEYKPFDKFIIKNKHTIFIIKCCYQAQYIRMDYGKYNRYSGPRYNLYEYNFLTRELKKTLTLD